MLKSALMACSLVLFLVDGTLSAEKLAEGDKLDVLVTGNGRKFEQVTVRAILPDGLKILHSTGAITIPAVQLPQYREVFASIQPTPVTPKPAEPPVPETTTPAWMPTSIADVAACSLFVRVSKGIGVDNSEASWEGSGFLCNQGSSTYVYSNAHCFDGAMEFTIADSKGNQYSDFESVEIAAEGNGFWKETGFGGDVVRIKLKTRREKALVISPEILSNETAKGRKIAVTGNTGGRGSITQLEGVISSIADNQIIKHNAATEEGNSGSPMVDTSSFKVIGILTWGLKLPDPLEAVWSKKPPESREGINFGAALATVRFVPTTFAVLQQQRAVLNRLKKNVRHFGLLDTLVPTKQGLFVDKAAVVMGDYTVEDLLAESSDHPVVKELVQLDRFLSAKAQSNIGINNQAMLKRYVESYRRCVDNITGQRKALENTTAATFYMKCTIRRSRIIEVSKAYENLSARCLQWYASQQGTGGKSLPVNQRYRLPAMRSGLKGLGIREG